MRIFALRVSFLLVFFISTSISTSKASAEICESIFKSVLVSDQILTPKVEPIVGSEVIGDRAPWLAVDSNGRFSAWKYHDSVEIHLMSGSSKSSHRLEADLAGLEVSTLSGDGSLLSLARDSFREQVVVNLKSGRAIYRSVQEKGWDVGDVYLTENGFFVLDPAAHRVSIFDADGNRQGAIDLPHRKFFSTGETALTGSTLDMWSISYSSTQRRLVLVPLGLSDQPKALVFAHVGDRFRQVSSFSVLEEVPSVKLSAPLSNAEIATQRLQYHDLGFAILAAHQSREMEMTRISAASVDFGNSMLQTLKSQGARAEIISSLERFELRTGNLVDSVKLPGLSVREFSFHADGQRLAVAGIRFIAGTTGARVVAVYRKDFSGSWRHEIDIPYKQIANRPGVGGNEQVSAIGWVDPEVVWVQTAAGQLNHVRLRTD